MKYLGEVVLGTRNNRYILGIIRVGSGSRINFFYSFSTLVDNNRLIIIIGHFDIFDVEQNYL